MTFILVNWSRKDETLMRIYYDWRCMRLNFSDYGLSKFPNHLACACILVCYGSHWNGWSVCLHLGWGVASCGVWRVSCCFRGQKYPVTMTTNIQQGTLLDVLKKKMRQTKEDMEKYKDECEEFHKRLQVEVMRREEVSTISNLVKYIDEGMLHCNSLL